MTTQIDCSLISDWDSFHSVFAEKMQFPSYYGRNMDAWIDCMSDLNSVTLILDNVDQLSSEFLSEVVDAAAFVNWREIEAGRIPIITLAYVRTPPRRATR